MLIIKATSEKIEAVLSTSAGSTAPAYYASFRDIADDNSTFSPNFNIGTTTGTSPVDVVPAPPASTRRVTDFLRVFNCDNVNHTVTLNVDISGVDFLLNRVVLAPNEALEYVDGEGFRVLTSSGSVKQAVVAGLNPVSSEIQTILLPSDVTNNNAVANTLANVTGLSFPVSAGRLYWFQFNIAYTAAATTTGSRWSIDGPALTSLMYDSDYSLTTTSRTINGGLAAYNLPAASNASSAVTTANTARIEGFIIPSADGNVIARFASEISSSAITAKAGSFVRYQQLT